MRLLLLTRYDVLGASSRLRSLQYIPWLEASGFSVTHMPLLSSDYLNNIYRSSGWLRGRIKSLKQLQSAMIGRLAAIIEARRYDVIWVEKEVFPYLPGSFEKMLSWAGVPYVVDYDDAIFHRYDGSQSRIVRSLLGAKLEPLLRGAFAVTAGNTYLTDYARSHGAARVEYVPTVLDIERYACVPEPEGKVFRICWIGSPSTASYLPIIYPALRVLSRERPIRLVTIGAPPLMLEGVAVEQHEWSLRSEARLIEGCHVGVMPLHNTPWELGKCGYKLLQYMACGRPVVASPVGVNEALVRGKAGFLAGNDAEWLEAFRVLAQSLDSRAVMGLAGRARVEENYTLQVMAPRISTLLTEAVASRRRDAA
jgi:glycosyltransferase involved in cell wall biosynthesis